MLDFARKAGWYGSCDFRDSRNGCDSGFKGWVPLVPFGTDALVLVLASTHGHAFWIVPPAVTVLSLGGAALTYWIGRAAGEVGLPRLIAPRHLDRIKARVRGAGAVTLAAAAVLPPPFPLTPFVLTCGALDLDRSRFFLVFGVMRLLRFGVLAVVARAYGAELAGHIAGSHAVQAALALFTR